MRREGKRIVSAWLLLSVFLLTTALSALHTHQPSAQAAAECVDCAHHVQHDGHLSPSGDSMHDCVLCQFLSLVYTAASLLTVMLFASTTQQGRFFLCAATVQREWSQQSTRAPPAIL